VAFTLTTTAWAAPCLDSRFHGNDSVLAPVRGAERSRQPTVEPTVIDTGQTVDVAGLDRWTAERIVIDIAQNHCDETRLKKAELWSEGWQDESRALKTGIAFVLKGGGTLGLEEAKQRNLTAGQVAAIVIGDNGDGYDSQMLQYRLSHGKAEEDIPIAILNAFQEGEIRLPGGQFGEGQKMLAASVLKARLEQQKASVDTEEPMGLIYRSHNWQARLFGKPVEIANRETIRTTSVAFEVSAAEQRISGSETIIENPAEDILTAALNIDDLVLDFAPPLKVVAMTNEGMAIEHKDGAQAQVYVRGYRICSVAEAFSDAHKKLLTPLFSYDLSDAEINRDRDKLQNERDLIVNIGRILLFGSSEEAAKCIFSFVEANPSFYAHSQSGSSTSSGEIMVESNALHYGWLYSQNDKRLKREAGPFWRQVFYAYFGDDALLASSSRNWSGSAFANESTQRAEDDGRKLAVLNSDLVSFLAHIGLTLDYEYDRMTVEVYKLGLALDYEKERWGPLRIVLDFLQNHTDEARDFSRQNQTSAEAKVEFQLQGSTEWLPWAAISGYQNEDIAAIRFSDTSARGYSHAHLQQFGSKKPQSGTPQVGQFGEGLKIASAASLRLGFDVDLRSRDWMAEAFSHEVPIENGQNFLNLGYKVIEEARCEGSETTVRCPAGPTAHARDARANFNQLLDIVRDLERFVLCHTEAGLAQQDPEPLFSAEMGSIVSAQEGNIYVKDFFITSEERERLIFSYNFSRVETNRDRSIVSNNELGQEVGEVLSRLQNKGLISRVIEQAVETTHDKYYEFQNLSGAADFRQNKNLWAEAFRELYGHDAVLKSENSIATTEADFIGYQVKDVNKEVALTLRAAGILFDYEVIRPTFNFLEEELLTNQERDALEVAKRFDEEKVVFPGSALTQYHVFEEAVNRVDGRPMPQIIGYTDPEGEFIAFKRQALGDPVRFLEVYCEEKAHQISRAGDGSREHVRQFQNAIVWLVHLKDNAKRANEILAEAFPGFSVEELEPVVDESTGRIEVVVETRPSWWQRAKRRVGLDAAPSPVAVKARPGAPETGRATAESP